MGIKRLAICFAVIIITFLSVANTFSQEYTPKMVRVSISDNAMQKFAYDKITIIATENYRIYDLATHQLLLDVPMCEELSITIDDETLTLNVNEDHVACVNPITIECPNGLLGIKDLKRKGKQALYAGNLEIIRCKTPKNMFYIVNVLELEEYLKGVVPNEMPVSFGLEALKAQTIAARNYVLSPRTRYYKEFDVADTVASQVYFGANTQDTASNRAIKETKGLVALYNWNLILAQYSSTAGGHTESYENAFPDNFRGTTVTKKPYLIAQPDLETQFALNTEEKAKEFYTTYPDSFDIKSPYYRWTKNWTKTELEDVLKKTLISQSKTGFVEPKFTQDDDLDDLKEIRVLKRGNSGKIIELEIVTTSQIFTIKKELVIRRIFQKNNISLPSANVYFEQLYDKNNELAEIIAYGGGFGHGVGLSQYGAGFMATNLKAQFDDILKHYYTGISITTEPVILSSYPTQKEVIQEFYLPRKKANLVVNNKFQVNKIDLTINEKVVPIFLQKGINVIDISEHVKKGENIAIYSYPSTESSKKAVRLYIELTK